MDASKFRRKFLHSYGWMIWKLLKPGSGDSWAMGGYFILMVLCTLILNLYLGSSSSKPVAFTCVFECRHLSSGVTIVVEDRDHVRPSTSPHSTGQSPHKSRDVFHLTSSSLKHPVLSNTTCSNKFYVSCNELCTFNMAAELTSTKLNPESHLLLVCASYVTSLTTSP